MGAIDAVADDVACMMLLNSQTPPRMKWTEALLQIRKDVLVYLKIHLAGCQR